MNKYNNDYTCQICFTTYLKKSTLQKHKILCEFSQFSKRERQNDIEETEPIPIPTHRELFKIVQQIYIENQNMKIKIKKMETFINTNLNINSQFSLSNNKSSKKNIVEELNNPNSSSPTPIPSLSFEYWLDILLTDTDIITENILFLLDTYSVQEVISIIISKQYYSNLEIDINNPILVVNKKTSTSSSSSSSSSSQNHSLTNGKNDVFIWGEEEVNEWKIMTEEKIQSVSKKIVSQLLKNILKWNIENSLKIRTDEKLGSLYMKIMNKLSSVPDNSHYTISIMLLDVFKNHEIM